MRILFYGRLAEAIGRELDLDVQAPSSIADIRERLAIEYPAAASSLRNGRALTCIDGTLVGDDHRVAADERVEFLAPLSGG